MDAQNSQADTTQNQTQQDPGTLSYVPKSPEAAPMPAVEKAPPTETIAPVEQTTQPPQTPQPAPVTTIAPAPTIVDMREPSAPGVDLKTTDKTTDDADTTEQEFIDEVNAAHGSQ